MTDPGFAKKARDLIAHNEFTLENINLIKSGRYFRLSDDLKVIAGRSEDENNRLLKMAKDGDFIFKALHHPGPIVLSRGNVDTEQCEFIAGITARYSDAAKGLPVEVEYYKFPADTEKSVIKTTKCEQDLLEKIRV